MAGTVDDKLVKKGHRKTSFSKEQILELQLCMDPVNGPEYFMRNFMYVQHPVKGKMKYIPYQYQNELLRTYHDYRYSIVMLGRQLGKTTVAAGYLLWYAMFIPDSTILVASKSGDDSKEIMERIRYAYEEVPDHIRAGVTEYNKGTITFDNKSRIISKTTTENTGRGMSVSLIYLDEFAFVDPPRVAEELWTSLSPTLSTGGKCIISSTPNNELDTFAKLWFDANNRIDEYGNERELGINGFRPYKALWDVHPDRDEEWEKTQRSNLGDDKFDREHNCKFIVFEETLINASYIAKLRPKSPIRKSGEVRWYSEINPDRTYVVALDPSMGTGGDNAAIEVWELPTFRQVAEWQHNKTIIEGQMRILKDILKEIYSQGQPELYWSVETNSLGEAALVVIREQGEDSFPGEMLHDPRRDLSMKNRRKGFVTSNKSKIEACSKFKSLTESGKLEINSKNLINEISTYIAKGVSYEAKTGLSDDLVSATLLFIRMAQHISTWDDESHRKFVTSNEYDDDDDDDYGAPMPIVFC